MTKEEYKYITVRAQDSDLLVTIDAGKGDYIYVSCEQDENDYMAREIVLALHHLYGLRFCWGNYGFDEISAGVEDFPKRLSDQHCIGFLTFMKWDYRAVMEFMYAQTVNKTINGKSRRLPIIPIDLNPEVKPDKKDYERNTRFGMQQYDRDSYEKYGLHNQYRHDRDMREKVVVGQEVALFKNLYKKIYPDQPEKETLTFGDVYDIYQSYLEREKIQAIQYPGRIDKGNFLEDLYQRIVGESSNCVFIKRLKISFQNGKQSENGNGKLPYSLDAKKDGDKITIYIDNYEYSFSVIMVPALDAPPYSPQGPSEYKEWQMEGEILRQQKRKMLRVTLSNGDSFDTGETRGEIEGILFDNIEENSFSISIMTGVWDASLPRIGPVTRVMNDGNIFVLRAKRNAKTGIWDFDKNRY